MKAGSRTTREPAIESSGTLDARGFVGVCGSSACGLCGVNAKFEAYGVPTPRTVL